MAYQVVEALRDLEAVLAAADELASSVATRDETVRRLIRLVALASRQAGRIASMTDAGGQIVQLDPAR